MSGRWKSKHKVTLDGTNVMLCELEKMYQIAEDTHTSSVYIDERSPPRDVSLVLSVRPSWV